MNNIDINKLLLELNLENKACTNYKCFSNNHLCNKQMKLLTNIINSSKKVSNNQQERINVNNNRRYGNKERKLTKEKHHAQFMEMNKNERL